jgi:hypothetical protein
VLRFGLCAAAAACSFQHGQVAPAGDGRAPDDATRLVDTAGDEPPPGLCGPQPGLHVCFSFDADELTSPLPNEATASVSMELTSVTRVADGTGGGAAQVDPSSKLFIPPSAELVDFAAAEMWVRVDVAPSGSSRVGLLDADITSSAMSFFYYRQSGTLQVRYELGQQLFLDATLPIGTWVYVAQSCEGNTLRAYLDGVELGSRTGCTPGDATLHGLIVGANSIQNGNKNEELTGAIGGLRLWTAPRSATAICEAAGRNDC